MRFIIYNTIFREIGKQYLILQNTKHKDKTLDSKNIADIIAS